MNNDNDQPTSPFPEGKGLKEASQISMRKIIVLDDDPTGIQTVHGCKLITQWDVQTVREAYNDSVSFFYILTNTRAMTRNEAAAVTREAMRSVVCVLRESSENELPIFISRSDSCLRGHFPLETDTMRQVLEENGIKVWHKTPFIPVFIEAGRVTIDGVHYMVDGNNLIPIAETEFAKDNVFGYTHSRLSDYIVEKGANQDDYEIVNAASYDELRAYVEKLTDEISGFDGAVVVRSSSSFPKAVSGITDRPLLERKELLGNKACNNAGMFIVGSHVQKTTRQLNSLLSQPEIVGIELDVEKIINSFDNYLKETLLLLRAYGNQKIKVPVIYTSRKEIRLTDADKRQQLGQTVSAFLVEIVRKLPFTPSYLVAKGGITSHDILTKGLGVRIATVMGQIIPNVPCVMADDFPYVIFPGNVGNDNSLTDVYQTLCRA